MATPEWLKRGEERERLSEFISFKQINTSRIRKLECRYLHLVDGIFTPANWAALFCILIVILYNASEIEREREREKEKERERETWSIATCWMGLRPPNSMKSSCCIRSICREYERERMMKIWERRWCNDKKMMRSKLITERERERERIMGAC